MNIRFSSTAKRKGQADLLIAGFFEKGKIPAEIENLAPAFAAELKTAVQSNRFEGKFCQSLSTYSSKSPEAKEIVILGLGKKDNFFPLCLRKAVGTIAKIATERKAKLIRIILPTFSGNEVSAEDAAGIITEGLLLSTYDFDKYKSKPKDDAKKPALQSFEILLDRKQNEAKFQKASDEARAIGEGILFARNVINEPGNVMTPQKLAQAARELARKKGISSHILEESDLKRLKMGGILAVNQGSTTPCALIVLEYGQRFKKKGTVCIVGKGVTFDTGGISIKPAKDMEKMKYDMSGAAAVIGAIGAVADLALPVHVVALAPTVENNVAEDPQRPGDIIRMYNGKTVEVLNTDAEGRLILADALAYAEKFSPKAIIDLATLTGMCAATFGDKCIGLMTNDEKLAKRVKSAGDTANERCWELPMFKEYADQIRGHHSDLLNIGGAYGGTITAAKFLEEFVPEKTAWVHLDIAGMAWCDSPRYDCPKGATGVGVRLLAKFLQAWK